MLTPATFVFALLVFAGVGVFFLFIHLLMGKVIRPSVPDTEKLTIYECGEPTVGSAWVQFDLRYYVVALLFVIFDVEVAFFFPWAVVFGTNNEIAHIDEQLVKPVEVAKGEKPAELTEAQKKHNEALEARRLALSKKLMPAVSNARKTELRVHDEKDLDEKKQPKVIPIDSKAAAAWSQIAFWDIAIFFGVLMVGFAYVWRRGDINWVKAYAHHEEPAIEPEKPLEQHAQPPPAPTPTPAPTPAKVH